MKVIYKLKMPIFFIFLLLISMHANARAALAAIPSIPIAFGKPTDIQVLYYLKMYVKKPYHYAIIYFYHNGLYKIVSPGEEHYGAYVVEGQLSNSHYSIHYMALPSKDWKIIQPIWYCTITSTPIILRKIPSYLAKKQFMNMVALKQ